MRSTNDLYGDATFMFDNSRGGNDMLIAGNNANNFLVGDAHAMSDNARGGDDTLIGGDNSATSSTRSASSMATPYVMSGNARGGNDTLIGGDGSINYLYGDAHEMHDNARGGNDTLTGARWFENTSTATPAPCLTTPAAAMTR